MKTLTAPSPSLPGRPQQWSTRIAFFIAGLGTAAWAPLVPFARARADLDEAGLGLLLLCLGVGSLLAMPVAGALAVRHGCRRVLVPAGLLMCAVLPVLATAGSPFALAAALFLFGVAVGTLDCVANVQAVVVERAAGRPMMSGFHGLYSLGGIAGAGGVSAMLVLGLSPLAATWTMVALACLALLGAARHFLVRGGPRSGAVFAMPRGMVLFIGLLCFIVFLTEGAMLDWAAVFLVTAHRLDPTIAGFGYTAFAAAMTLVRLCGDAIVARFPSQRVLLLGALCASGGMALATLAPWWPLALAGYALVGAGCANIVPVLFSAAGRQRSMPESLAIPAISTLGYAGILAGPALIGAFAHVTGLVAALLGIALLLLGVAAASRYLQDEKA